MRRSRSAPRSPMQTANSADKSGMFEWKPEYSVGINSIDGQHQNLFVLARDLHTAMSSGQGKLAVGRILDRLVHYTATHFAHEERLMEQCQYPGLANHQMEHRVLTQKVR